MEKRSCVGVCMAVGTVAIALAAVGCSSTKATPGPSDSGAGNLDATGDDASPPPGDGGPPGDGEAGDSATDDGPAGLDKIGHIVVIILENWSYDSLYAEVDAGDGLTGPNGALAAAPQTDVDGAVYAPLPQTEAHLLDASLPNAPFPLDPYVSVSSQTSLDNTNNFYIEQQQIHGGAMDRFVALNGAKGLAMGYYHLADLPLAKRALEYTICDHFFHPVFGGSLQNNMFLVTAGLAQFPDAGPSLYSVVDDAGNVISNKPLTPDGYVVGTLQPAANPHAVTVIGDAAAPSVPPQTGPTIGDELTAAGVDWAWYAGGWNDALQGVDAGQLYQPHHQPFVYFANYAEGTPGRAAHLKDENDFIALATGQDAGTLPPVSFVKPVGIENEHPLYASVSGGDQHALDLVDDILNGPYGDDAAIIITYDENGGFWDHVPPPVVDRWGPGTRIPAIVISKYAKRGYVDSTVYDTTSITATIERRFGLQPLGTRDRDAKDLSNAFDFNQ